MRARLRSGADGLWKTTLLAATRRAWKKLVCVRNQRYVVRKETEIFRADVEAVYPVSLDLCAFTLGYDRTILSNGSAKAKAFGFYAIPNSCVQNASDMKAIADGTHIHMCGDAHFAPYCDPDTSSPVIQIATFCACKGVASPSASWWVWSSCALSATCPRDFARTAHASRKRASTQASPLLRALQKSTTRAFPAWATMHNFSSLLFSFSTYTMLCIFDTKGAYVLLT